MSAETKKRASKRIPLTPAELAEARAAHIVELRAKINNLEGELAEETDELAKYVEQTGQEEFGALKAIKRVGAAKIVGDLTPNELKYATEQLMNELPDFVKHSLDMSKMFNALRTDSKVANALSARGLSMEQTASWTFRAKSEK